MLVLAKKTILEKMDHDGPNRRRTIEDHKLLRIYEVYSTKAKISLKRALRPTFFFWGSVKRLFFFFFFVEIEEEEEKTIEGHEKL